MRTIWQSLIWKEWHEHKWKLSSLTAILWSIATLGLIDPERGSLVGVHVALVVAIVPLAIFIGLGVAAGERSRNTMPFLQALPVPMWRVALHKLAAGLATVLVPAFLTIVFVFAWLELSNVLGADYRHIMREITRDFDQDAPFVLVDQWFANTTLALTVVASGFFLWTVAAGVNRKDEVSAGAVALTVIMAWCVLMVSAWAWYGNGYVSFSDWPSGVGKWLAVAGAAAAPGGLATLEDAVDKDEQYFLFAVCVTGFTMLTLASWYVHRFARHSKMEVRSPKVVEVAVPPRDWLGAPRHSAVTAIAWKQIRESGPLALLGIAVVLALSAVFFLVAAPTEYRRDEFGLFLEFFAVVSFSIGLAVAMIVGIGVFLYDVGPGLSAFWRSRPINPDLWFWIKFSSGLAVALVAIYGPIVLLALPRVTEANLGNDELLVFPSITIAVFAAAAAMTCLVRNAVYAAILSVAVAYLGYVGTVFTVAGARIIHGGIWPENVGDVFTDVTATQGGSGMFITFLVCMLLAWLAVRNDWGQKSRY
jgi:hypothetical protein